MKAIGTDQSQQSQQTLNAGLGWFSLGLGLANFFMPKRVSRLTGLRANPFLIRMIGLREIACGLGLLRQRDTSGWLWTRVSGDMMDLGMLAGARLSNHAEPRRFARTMTVLAGVTAVDALCAVRSEQTQSGIHIARSLIVNRSPEELYQVWRHPENLPRFMRSVKAVREIDDTHSHWVVEGAAGKTVEWNAEISEDRPNQLIAWRSIEGAEVEMCASVRFEPATGNRGTLMRVEFDYQPPSGLFGTFVGMFLGKVPEHRVATDLHRFKRFMETGTILGAKRESTEPTSGGIPSF